MHLSKIERWILSNQLRILAALSPDSDDRTHYARGAEAIERGYAFAYRDAYGHIDDTVLSEEACLDVIKTMSMFDAMGRAWRDGARRGASGHRYTSQGEGREQRLPTFSSSPPASRRRASSVS